MFRGWNYNPANIVLNTRFRLDLPRLIMYDWAHIYVHDGLGDVEFGLCLSFLQNGSEYATSFAEWRIYKAVSATKVSSFP